VATICVQTGLNPARHILERPCQYVRCHGMNFFGDVCFQGVYGSLFVLVNKTNHEQNKTNPLPNDRSAEKRVREETGWLAGGPMLRVATIRRTADTHYRQIPLNFSHNESTPVQISLQYLHWC